MAIAYSYSNYKDEHVLKNNGVIDLRYTIVADNCGGNTPFTSGLLISDQSVTLPFKVDGTYSVQLETEFAEQPGPVIKYYKNLLVSFLSNVEQVLCGCAPCNDCEECTDCQTYLASLTKAIAYANLMAPIYTNNFNTIANNSICTYSNDILCSLMNEKVYGNPLLKETLLNIVANYYAAFYAKDMSLAMDASEKQYVKEKYKASKIMKCVERIGIDLGDLKPTTGNEETNPTVYYYQLSDYRATHVSNTSQVDLEGAIFLNTLPYETLDVFAGGFNITYTDVGRIAFAIKGVPNANFQLIDMLNNDITDQFEVSYLTNRGIAVFTSNLIYSHGKIFFKFKQL
jgi:hypothetical protein